MKVAILGSTGMLGSMVHKFLSSQSGYELIYPTRNWLDVSEENILSSLRTLLMGSSYVVNCIGVIKPRINEQDRQSIECAIRVNAIFPNLLAVAAERTGCQVLQIATDCVYSGRTGSYIETSPHDATDIYGKTKSLGEVRSPQVHHLRCSIIGPEPAGRPKDSLLEWFLGQPVGSRLKGFTNHRWNGITTLAFAKICHGIMSQGIELPSPQHVVPYNPVTKAELLSHFAYFYYRKDVSVGNAEAPASVDRTLDTSKPSLNEKLWEAAGYKMPPLIEQMIGEMAVYQ